MLYDLHRSLLDLSAALQAFADLLGRVSHLLLWLLGQSCGGGTKQGGGGTKQSLLQRLRSSWIPIPTGVGITLLALLQWRRLERERTKRLGVARDWEISCYRAIPLRSLSRVFGWVSEREVPVSLRPLVYTAYARTFSVDTDEMERPLDSYRSIGSFFARRLKDGVRPVHNAPIVSPADGLVLNSGRLDSFHVEQVKGVTYSVRAFLGEATWRKTAVSHKDANNNHSTAPAASPLRCEEKEMRWAEYKKLLVENPGNELYQCVVYLAPGDYHRFHSPVDFAVSFRRHFQGDLLSVNPTIAKWIPDLFTLNERAVYVGRWEHGYFSMTAVGATNVGSIRVHDDKTLETNGARWKGGRREKERRLECSWAKGEEVGEFRMGSTLVLIFEAPPEFRSALLPPGSRVKVGLPLASAAAAPV